MSGGPVGISGAIEEHRAVIAASAAAIRRVDPADWDRSAGGRKWTRAQIAEHLAMSYDPLLSELDGGPGFRVVVPPWKRTFLRWIVLPQILRGTFPKAAPAPREIRPAAGSPDPETAALRLSERADAFLGRIERAARLGRVRLTHAYFGRISGFQALKLLTSHANHHGRQLGYRAPEHKEEPRP